MTGDLRQEQASFVLTPQSVSRADAAAVAAGTPALALMDRAAGAVVRAVRGRFTPRPVVVLAGPGQNGGDGWVVADLLRRAGWPVALHATGGPEALSGAAREAALRSGSSFAPLAEATFAPEILVVDALFGAGLSRDVDGTPAEVLSRLGASDARVVAVDLPSGVDGATGAVRGVAAPAELTVTFHRPKPGHLLQPGAALCGEVIVAEIGLADDAPDALHAHPRLWTLPRPGPGDHKYARGAVLVLSGPAESAGAARLAAAGAARAGAGAVTLACPPGALAANARHVDAVMVRGFETPDELADLAAARRSALVAGPGAGTTGAVRERVRALLGTEAPIVLDADALTVWAGRLDAFAEVLHVGAVLTPHEGEFSRLFPDLSGDKLARAQAAADRLGATVLLKGPDTVIASPGAVPVIATHGAPWLATAGSGDVLSGVIAALMAAGLSPRAAASAGAWLHGEAGRLGGPGLTADDLPALIGRAYAEALDRQDARP